MDSNQISQDQIVVAQANFITRVYAWMSGALIITGIVAAWAAATPAVSQLIFGNSWVFYALIISELLTVVYLTSVINKIEAQTATLVFLIYAALNGLTMSVIFMIYTSASIASTFYITAGTFGAMSLYGYYTKKDLTSLGNIAFMGLIGLIIASVVNFFFQNEMLYWIVTYLGVLIFVALTAYDTQKIKRMGASVDDDGSDDVRKAAIMGALILYLDFINLFLYLLRIFGRRR
jgi:FtsH-binding integral membrane protein